MNLLIVPNEIYLPKIFFGNRELQERLSTKRYFLNCLKDKHFAIYKYDGPVSLHWLICKILSYQTFQYLGIGLKHKTPKTGLKLVSIILNSINYLINVIVEFDMNFLFGWQESLKAALFNLVSGLIPLSCFHK